MFVLLWRLAPSTAARVSSPCLALYVVGGHVLAHVMVPCALFCHALLLCLDVVNVFSLLCPGSVVAGWFAAALLARGGGGQCSPTLPVMGLACLFVHI